MYNVFSMHMFQTFCDLPHNISSLFFRHFFLFLHLLQTTIRQQLQYKIKIILIMEVAIQRSDMWVIKVALKLDFSYDVFLYFRFSDSFFGHFFNYANET